MEISTRQRWGIIFLIFIILVYLAIYFLKFQESSTREVTEIYYADRITAAHKILIDKYNKLNEGRVKVIPIDFPNIDFSTNERKEVMARLLRSKGDGIDLFAVDVVWVQRFAKWGEPLDKYFSDSEKQRILKSAMESCYSEGELVAVPLDLVQSLLYYREDLLKKQPKGDEIISRVRNGMTWTDFIKLKDQIGVKYPYYIFPAADFEGMICTFIELLLSIKPDYFHEEGFNFATPEAEKALQLMVDLINKYQVTPPVVTNFTEVPSYEYFIKNDGIFLRGWKSYDKDFKESPYDTTKERYLRKAPLPHFENGRPTSLFGGWDLMVSKFSDKKKEAVDFAKYLISDEAQELFYKESGYYPVTNKFYEDAQSQKKYPEISQLKELLKIGYHRPAHVEYTKFSKIMSSYFEKALKNQLSVKEALKQCTADIQLDKSFVKDF